MFFFLPRAVGATAYPSLQRSLRGMEQRQPCPEGLENERHMGPSVPGPPWLGSRGRVWAPWSGNRPGKASGEAKAHGFRKMAHLRGFGVQVCRSGLSTRIPPFSPSPETNLEEGGSSHLRDPDTCRSAGEGMLVKVGMVFLSSSGR